MSKKKEDFSVLKKKILQYADYKKISKREIYQNTGISDGILSQNNGLTELNILKFLTFFEDISLDWLFLGKGRMIKEDDISKHTVCSCCQEKERIIQKSEEVIKTQRETIETQKEAIFLLKNENKSGAEGVYNADAG